MSKKIIFYKGKTNSFALPIFMFLALIGLIFFALFGALAFLFFGALGIGATFLRMIFPKQKDKNKIDKDRSNEIITLEKDDYKIIKD